MSTSGELEAIPGVIPHADSADSHPVSDAPIAVCGHR